MVLGDQAEGGAVVEGDGQLFQGAVREVAHNLGFDFQREPTWGRREVAVALSVIAMCSEGAGAEQGSPESLQKVQVSLQRWAGAARYTSRWQVLLKQLLWCAWASQSGRDRPRPLAGIGPCARVPEVAAGPYLSPPPELAAQWPPPEVLGRRQLTAVLR